MTDKSRSYFIAIFRSISKNMCIFVKKRPTIQNNINNIKLDQYHFSCIYINQNKQLKLRLSSIVEFSSHYTETHFIEMPLNP